LLSTPRHSDESENTSLDDKQNNVED